MKTEPSQVSIFPSGTLIQKPVLKGWTILSKILIHIDYLMGNNEVRMSFTVACATCKLKRFIQKEVAEMRPTVPKGKGLMSTQPAAVS